MTRVLVVEDDPALRRSLVVNLTARGYGIDEAGTGEDALARAGVRPPDIALVDLGLPVLSGLEVIRWLRRTSDVPILVLSARGAEQDKVEALDAGATDYVTKPFGVEELLARLRVAERLRVTPVGEDQVVRTGYVTIDPDRRVVTRRDGADVHLTPIEWGLLTRLIAHPGRLVRQAELLLAVWGPGYERETSYLRVHLAHVRKKIEEDPSRPVHLVTEPGVGYRFHP